jgi:hypothetical protein
MARAESAAARSSASLRLSSEDFIDCYSRPHFGWETARSFANERATFPLLLKGMDEWVFKAYLMFINPVSYYDRHIADAYAMWDAVMHKKYLQDAKSVSAMPGGVLMSMLLLCATRKSDLPVERNINDIANSVRLPYATVCAFASLFYDMLDRAKDGQRLAIAADVYPDGRLEEQREDYIDRVATVDVLKRIGYNGGDADTVAWAAGLGDRAYVTRLVSSDGAEAEFTKAIIGNGLLMSKTLGLNTRHVGINRATHLISASRQAGGVVEEPTLTNLYPHLSTALQAANDRSHVVKRETQKEQARRD